jgi:hypothetical protein
MPNRQALADYKPEARGHKTAFPAECPGDLPAVEELLNLLGRAVRQFHTYPSASPLCVDAITACHKALAALEGRDRVAFRVTPRELIVDEVGVGSGTVIEQELVRRLHRSGVATVDVDRVASPRDLSRFCGDLNCCDEYIKAKTTLADMLVEHGVDAIVLRMAHRPEVLDVGAPRAPLRDIVESERRRREAVPASAGPVQYLYPPEKGWVRLDPAARFDAISLIDLAILVQDPGELAMMLLRLTDDEPTGEKSRDAALDQKFSDVAMMFAALEPRLARMMFARLSRAVLDLEPERRKELLQRTVLPGLLDGRADGLILRDFPDFDLAEAIFLLLDLETAAPEVLTTALDRLELPQERRQNVVPLLEARLRNGHAPLRDDTGGRELSIDRYARKLIRVDAAANKNFAEFAAFDLSIDDHTTRAIASLRGSIDATNVSLAQLDCLWNLVKLQPNPRVVDELINRALTLFAQLERASRWSDFTMEMSRYLRLADRLREARPDVADAIFKALSDFWTLDRVTRIGELYERDGEGRTLANSLVESCGVAMAPAFTALLEGSTVESKARTVVLLMCDHATLLAPALMTRLDECGLVAARLVVRVLGFAGQGCEEAVAGQLGRGDEQTGREALRALARIGTDKAAAVVADHLRRGGAGMRASAEEALWHFPPAQTLAQVLDVLGHRDFVLRNPATAGRLLDRAAQLNGGGLRPVLPGLTSLRFRFWSPAVVRVARKARGLLER